jgi:methyl-accepting chemotaxis protein
MLAGESDHARELLTSTLEPLFNTHREAVTRVVDQANSKFGADEQVARETLAARNTTLWTVVGIAGLGSVLLGWLIARGVTRPIAHMVGTMGDIATGRKELSVRLDESRKDELGALAKGVNGFTSKLAQMIRSAGDASREVKSSAGALQEIASSTSTRIDQQSARVREVASAMTEMSASASEVAQQASEASKTAEDSRRVAGAGGKAVDDTIKGMQGIQQAMTRSSTCVHTLGERGQAIGQMIQIINDIADQTNLLALNAAIEAARAGEHGRGFAVVADEVRKLADRTTKATGEISQSIKQIQEETLQAVESMDAGAKEVRAGSELAAKAGEDLDRIVKSAASVTSLIGTIATAAAEQSSTTEHISRALDEISNVTEQTQQSTRESLDAIEQLSGRATQLERVITECGLKA